MKQLISFILITILATMSSCQKKDTTVAQPDKVVITVASPANGSIYRKGDQVVINAAVSYVSQLHGYSLKITDSTGRELYYYDEHVHSDKVDISKTWTDTLSSNTGLQLEIIAEIDHNGNENKTQISFQSQP